jgi:hypothetical protein
VPVSGGFAEAAEAYRGSDGDATHALYARLGQHGPAGVVAVNLFRAQKASERAKVYRGGARGRGSFRAMAYDRKGWAIGNLCTTLATHAGALGIVWGWGFDPDQPVHRLVLYVDLPSGQVSFHAAERGPGPDYPASWDGVPAISPQRILTWIGRLLDGAEAAP